MAGRGAEGCWEEIAEDQGAGRGLQGGWEGDPRGVRGARRPLGQHLVARSRPRASPTCVKHPDPALIVLNYPSREGSDLPSRGVRPPRSPGPQALCVAVTSSDALTGAAPVLLCRAPTPTSNVSCSKQ